LEDIFGGNDISTTSTRRGIGVEKIFQIIANHDDRNKNNLVLTDSKILFAKEKPSLSSAKRFSQELRYNEGHFIDIRQPLFDEDKDRTNSTYLNSVRNPLSDHTNSRKKLITLGTNMNGSIGLNTLRHDENSHRSHITRAHLHFKSDEQENSSNIISARSKKNDDETEKLDDGNIENEQSFSACCKKGINRLFCS